MKKFFMLMVVAAFVMVGCSDDKKDAGEGKSSSLASLVDGDADVIARINPSNILANANCYANGKIVLSNDVKNLMQEENLPVRQINNYLGTLSESLDLSEVWIYGYYDGSSDFMCLVKVTDDEKLEQSLGQIADDVDEGDDYTCYNIEGTAFAVVDGVLHITDNAYDIQYLLSKESASPLDQKEALYAQLTEGGDIAVAAYVPGTRETREVEGLADSHVIMQVALDGSKLTAQARVLKSDGTYFEAEKMVDKISSGSYTYLPADYNALFAIGKITAPEFKQALNELCSDSDFAPYASIIKAFDGSTVAAAQLPINSYTLYNMVDWSYMSDSEAGQVAFDILNNSKVGAVGGFSGTGANDAVNTWVDLVYQNLGSEYVSGSGGEYVTNFAGLFNVYTNNLNGKLFVGNYSPYNGGAVAPDFFNDSYMAAQVNIPRGRFLESFGLNFGVSLSAWLNYSSLNAELQLTGNSDKLLATLIHMASSGNIVESMENLQQYADRKAEQYYNSYYNYYDYEPVELEESYYEPVEVEAEADDYYYGNY